MEGPFAVVAAPAAAVACTTAAHTSGSAVREAEAGGIVAAVPAAGAAEADPEQVRDQIASSGVVAAAKHPAVAVVGWTETAAVVKVVPGAR